MGTKQKNRSENTTSGSHILTPSISEYISELLRGSGLRMTLQRKALIEELEKSKVGLSIKDIYKKMNSKKIKIDEASVYRTVEALKKLDLVHSLSDGKFKLCSHIACDQSFHLSLICTSCGKVTEPHLNLKNETQIAESLNLHLNQIKNIQINFTCTTCLKTL